MGITKLPSGSYRLQIRRRKLNVDRVFTTQREAIDAEAQYLATLRTAASTPTLLAAWEDYEKSLMFREKRDRTRGTEKSRIKTVLRILGSALPVGKVTAHHVEKLILERMDSKPKPSSDAIRLEVAALSSLMNFALERRWIPANPCAGVHRPAAAIVPRRMSQEDEGKLIELLRSENIRYRFAARLCLLVRETGARPGEWQNTNFDDIDFVKRTVTFRNTKYRGQPRTVPLTKVAMGLLQEHLFDINNHFADFDGTDLLFPAKGNDGTVRPMHYTGALRDAKKKALLPRRVRAHTGRHEYISTLVESSTLSDARIMALVGHHSPASMEVYKHVRNIQFRPQIEKVELRRRAERMFAVAHTLKVLPQVVAELLLDERASQKALGSDDANDELLYSDSFVEKLLALTASFGVKEHERIRASMTWLAARRAEKTATDIQTASGAPVSSEAHKDSPPITATTTASAHDDYPGGADEEGSDRAVPWMAYP